MSATSASTRLQTIETLWRTSPVRRTMFEILQCCNTRFRSTYARVARDVVRRARAEGISTIVELGAGSGPLTREIAVLADARDLRLILCDLVPDVAAYEELQRRHPGQVVAQMSPVDYGEPHDWGPAAMLVLMGTFPAVAARDRGRVLANLTRTSRRVLVYEPLRKSLVSVISACLSLIPGLLLPLLLWSSPGALRRVAWCWLCPVAPLMFAADGVRWCFRCLTEKEWRAELDKLNDGARPVTIQSGLNWQLVTW